MSTKKLSRGLRNNNPGNIRKSKDKWQGLAEEQPDKEFFTFKDPTYGIRAMARILIKYQDDYNIHSVQFLIKRWAPPVENDTMAYVKVVAKAAGVEPKEEIDLHSFDVLFPIVKAIIKHENGSNPYTDAQITKGLVLAGVEPKKKSVLKDPKVQATGATAGLSLVSLSAEHIEKAAPAFSLMEKLAEFAPHAIGIVIVLIAGFVIYKIIDEKRKGL